MKSFWFRSLLLLLSASCAMNFARAEGDGYGAPSLLPVPEMGAPAYPTPNYNQTWKTGLANSPYRDTLTQLDPQARQAAAYAPAAAPAISAPATEPTASVESCGCDSGCGSCTGGCCGCNIFTSNCGGWFGGMGGIFIGRNNPNKFWTTYETNNNPNQLMNTQDANGGFRSGGEFTVGRWFCPSCCSSGCGLYGVSFSYWTVNPLTGHSEIASNTNTLSTPIDLGFVTVNNGTTLTNASDYFDNAAVQKIDRQDYINSFELNFLNQQMWCNCNYQVTWLAGLRYFRFGENLTYGSASGGNAFGDGGGAFEAYQRSQCINNLLGFQLGTRVDYYIFPRMTVFLMPKVGIYGNNMHTTNQVYTGNGFYFDANGTPLNIGGQKTDFSFIGELDAGATYQFATNWRAYAGYRVLGITGLALADNQFLPFMADTAGFADVKSNSDLILHGGFAGVEFRY